jgi:ketosteroid isomerase-like protein
VSRRNVDVVQALYELRPEDMLSGTELGEFFDPEVEWFPPTASLMSVEGYRGYEGIRALWQDLLSTWEEYQPIPEEVLDFGDQVVVIMRMRARSSRGIEINEVWSALFTLRDARIVRVQGFTDRDAALDAVSERP